jgi:hypothetical protein
VKRLLLLCALVAGCATPPPPPTLISRPAPAGPAAQRRERTVTEVETVAPIYGGVPAEKATAAPPAR